MLWEKKVAQWSAAVRARANVPARLSLWGGQSYDFGTFDRPAVKKSPAAIPLLLDPSLDSLGEAYIKQKIDLDGRLADVIDIAYALAKASIGKPNKLQRVVRYFAHSSGW